MGKEILKLLLLGNINSGKSSLTSRRARENFSEKYTPTRGMNWVSLNKKEQKFLLVEISGQQQYQGFIYPELPGSSGICILVDLTQSAQDLHHAIENWMSQITLDDPNNAPPVFLIGTKADLASQESRLLEENKEVIRQAVASHQRIRTGFVTSAKEANSPDYNIQLGKNVATDKTYVLDEKTVFDNIVAKIILLKHTPVHCMQLQRSVIDILNKLEHRYSLSRKNNEKRNAIHDLISAINQLKSPNALMLLQTIKKWQIRSKDNLGNTYANNRINLDIMGEHRNVCLSERPGVLTESQRVIRSIKADLLMNIQQEISDNPTISYDEENTYKKNLPTKTTLENILEDSMTQLAQRIKTLEGRLMNRAHNMARAEALKGLLSNIRNEYITLTSIVDFRTNESAQTIDTIYVTVKDYINACLYPNDDRPTMTSLAGETDDIRASNQITLFSPVKKTTTKSMLEQLRATFDHPTTGNDSSELSSFQTGLPRAMP